MKKLPLYPFFFVLFSILGPIALNVSEVMPKQVLRPLLIAILTITLLTWAFIHLTREKHHGAFIAGILAIWFLYFGYINRILRYHPSIPDAINNPWLFLALWTLLLGMLASPLVWKHIRQPETLTLFFNWAGVTSLAIPAITIIWFIINTPLAAYFSQPPRVIPRENGEAASSTFPDIYYIVVDGYGRADMLSNIHGYDNSAFINFLNKKGFYVADQSVSNYMQTTLSLGSSLNMNYLDELGNTMRQSDNRLPLARFLDDSAIRAFLKTKGYLFVNTANIWALTDLRDADVYLTAYPNSLNAFELFWLDNSIVSLFSKMAGVNIPFPSYETHRTTIEYALNALKVIPTMPGPKFVFTHIIAPHPPFVFDQNGNSIEADQAFFFGDGTGFPGTQLEYRRGYIDEITFLNKELEIIITAILQNSSDRSVIIVQGDHGPGVYTDFVSLDKTCIYERFSILNAYYLPENGSSGLYPSITPVNTFRVILNSYFGESLPLLADRQYYSTRNSPYNFLEVFNSSQSLCVLP